VTYGAAVRTFNPTAAAPLGGAKKKENKVNVKMSAIKTIALLSGSLVSF
jgi:hypothetical protein